MRNKRCVFCKKPIEGHGCNPWPYLGKGQCCKKCDNETVIPLRLALRGVHLTPEDIKGMIEAEERMRQQFQEKGAIK